MKFKIFSSCCPSRLRNDVIHVVERVRTLTAVMFVLQLLCSYYCIRISFKDAIFIWCSSRYSCVVGIPLPLLFSNYLCLNKVYLRFKQNYSLSKPGQVGFNNSTKLCDLSMLPLLTRKQQRIDVIVVDSRDVLITLSIFR